MHNHSPCLIDYNYIGIFINNFYRYVFRFYDKRLRLRNNTRNAVARLYFVIRFKLSAIYGNIAGFNEFLRIISAVYNFIESD